MAERSEAHAMVRRDDPKTVVAERGQPARPVSVVVPAFNAEKHLPDQLAALSRQDAAIVGEIIVADNGSTDRTVALARTAARKDRRIRVVAADERRGAAHARNAGAASARGTVLAFCDADDVVSPNWAAALYTCMQREGARFVAGHNDHEALYPYPARRWPAAIYPQAGPADDHDAAFAEACNFAVTKQAFDAVEGFDESLRFAAEDIELSRRLRDAGFALVQCADAVVYYRDRATAYTAVRQAFRYGHGNNMLPRGGHTVGQRRRYAATAAARTIVGIARLFGPTPLRVTWLRQCGFRFGYLVGAFGSVSRSSRQVLPATRAPAPGPTDYR